MGTPTKKFTKGRTASKAAHWALKLKNLLTCTVCGNPVKPHRACNSCGNYKGKSVFEKVYAVPESAEKNSTSVKKNASSKMKTKPTTPQ